MIVASAPSICAVRKKVRRIIMNYHIKFSTQKMGSLCAFASVVERSEETYLKFLLDLFRLHFRM